MIILVLFLIVIFFIALAASLFAFAIARVISLAWGHGNQKRTQAEAQERLTYERSLVDRLIAAENEKIVAQTQYALLAHQIQVASASVAPTEEVEDDVLNAGEIDG